MKFIVAVTACPTGIAHTYMAAEQLERAAKEAGLEIKVETNGSIGVENALTDEEIAKADAVLICADMKVETDRFEGKPLKEYSVSAAVKKADKIMAEVINEKFPKHTL